VRLIDCTCYDLFGIRPTGTGRRLLSRGGARNLFDVSPARSQIVYSHSISVLSSSTITGAHGRMIASGSDIHFARYSPDGTKILYADDAPASACGHFALHVVDADGRNNRVLADSCASFFGTWSPDSKQIAYVRWDGTNDTSGEIVVVKADGSGAHILVSGRDFQQLAWAPTGDRIAYVAGGPQRMIHIVRTDGSKDIAIARGLSVQWSPDGRRLAFVWERGGIASGEVTVINRDGTHPRVIDARAVDPYVQGIGWSPDGHTIAYRTENPSQACSCMNLYIEQLDGGGRRPLVHGVEHEEFGPLYWTRDGKRLIYTRYVQFGQ